MLKRRLLKWVSYGLMFLSFLGFITCLGYQALIFDWHVSSIDKKSSHQLPSGNGYIFWIIRVAVFRTKAEVKYGLFYSAPCFPVCYISALSIPKGFLKEAG